MLIYDLVDPQELVGFVRNLEFDQFNLAQFLPNQEVSDLEYRFNRGNLQDQDAATYRAWDTEAPIGSRQGVQRVRGELPPISKKIRLGEEERLRMAALQSGDNSALIEQIFNDAANMTRAVQARMELARGEALHTGKVVISENGMEAEIDFGLPSSHDVSAATVWSDPEADVIEEALSWVETYQDSTGGLSPAAFLTSTKVTRHLLRNDQIRALAATIGGAPALVTEETLQQVFQAYGLPPFIRHDAQIRVNGTAQRVLPDDKIVALPPAGEPLGNTLYGVTAEALELQAEGQLVASQAPGIVAVVEKTFDPVSTWTKSAGIGVPVIANPELLFVATVL